MVPKKPRATSRKPFALTPWQKIFGGLVLFALLANLVGGYLGYQRLVVDAQTEQLNKLTQNLANNQADLVADYIDGIEKSLQRFAGRQLVASAITNDDETILARYTQTLEADLPNLISLRIFPRGEATLEREGEVPIRFAELDMINRAEKREPVFPEAARDDTGWRINFVQPVPIAEDSEAPVIASVFVSLDIASLQAALQTTDLTLGHRQLQQTFPNAKPQTLFELGQGRAGASQSASVPNSYWTVVVTPSVALAQTTDLDITPLYLGMASIVLVSLLLCYLLANIFARKATARAEQLAAAQRASKEARSDTNIADSRQQQKKIMEMVVADEDSRLVASQDEDEDPLDIRDEPLPQMNVATADIPADIFRAYDIRGRVDDQQLTPENVVLIGRAIGSTALEAGDKTIVVGRDGRTHSPEVSEQLIEGILATGCHVINVGMVPTPLVYFAICERQDTNSGVVVTASHNPPEDNGFKIVINEETLAGDKIQQLRSRILRNGFIDGAGKEDFADVRAQYVERIFSDVALAGEVSVVIDAGNGVAGEIAPELFNELGCQVTPLFCEVDGSFPNHQPDPLVYDNLKALIAKVQEVGADMGIALDGDGDRVGIVTGSGDIIAADRLLMLLAKDIVSRNPGADVIFDVKSSRRLNEVVTSYGGRPIMWKTGHSHMKAKMRETGALVGGELSGHIFIKERWYGFDDGLYAAARLMEIMSLREQSLDDIFAAFPALPATEEIKLPVADAKKFKFVQRLVAETDFGEGKLTTIDGVRVDYPDGWGLVRASNTSPYLTLRFEGETEEGLAAVQARFREALLALDDSLSLPF